MVQMEKNEIREIVIDLLQRKFNVKPELTEEKWWNEALTGLRFGFTGVMLVSLLFEVADCFQINIGEERLINYQFNSINGITDCVSKCMGEKNRE